MMLAIARTATRILAGVINRITSAGFVVGYLGFGALIIIYLYEIGSRYFFSSPTSWASDTISYVLSISIFLSLPRVTAESGHVAVTFAVQMASKHWRWLLIAFINVIGAALCTIIAYIVVAEVIRQIELGTLTIATHPIPKWYLTIFIAYGFAGSAWYFAVGVFNTSLGDKTIN